MSTHNDDGTPNSDDSKSNGNDTVPDRSNDSLSNEESTATSTPTELSTIPTTANQSHNDNDIDATQYTDKQRKALEIARRLAAKSGVSVTAASSGTSSPASVLGKRKNNIDDYTFNHTINFDQNIDIGTLFNANNILILERRTNCRLQLSTNDGAHEVKIFSLTQAELDSTIQFINDIVDNEALREQILQSDTGDVLPSSLYDPSIEPTQKQQRVDDDPTPAADIITQTILVDNERVGLVIGRGGETIKQLQLETNCHISIEKQPNSDGKRIVTLSGTPQQIQTAEQAIHYRMQGGRPGGPIQHNTQHQSSPNQYSSPRNNISDDRSEVISVPNDAVGILIGKGGETIRSMQSGSGANIQIQKDVDRDRSTDQRLITLNGTPQQRDAAKQLIDMNITQYLQKNGSFTPIAQHQQMQQQQQYNPSQQSYNAPYGQSSTSGATIIKVPNPTVGSIIGKQGETIKRLQAQTGCRIQISKDGSQPQREITITGAPQDIERARVEIDLVVQSRLQALGQGGNMQPQPPYQQPNMQYNQYAQPPQQQYSQYVPPAPYGLPPQQQMPYTQQPYNTMPQQQQLPPQQQSYDPNSQYAAYYAQMGYPQQAAVNVPPAQSTSPPTQQTSTDPNAEYYNTPEYQAYLAQYYAQLQQQQQQQQPM